MPFCRKCGNEINAIDRFCLKCGMPVEGVADYDTEAHSITTPSREPRENKNKGLILAVICLSIAVVAVLAVIAIWFFFKPRRDVVKAADTFAQALIKQDAEDLLELTAEDEDSEVATYYKDLFNSDNEIIDTIRETITYSVAENTLVIDNDKASVCVVFTMTDYEEAIEGSECTDISEVLEALEDCDINNEISVKMEFEKDGDDWIITNIDDSYYAELLQFYSYNFGLVEGKYTASFDCSDAFVEGMGVDVDLEGNLDAEFELKLEKGEYELVLDGDSFKANCEEYLSNNMDAILKAAFGTDDEAELAEYATYLGYADYDEMKAGMLEETMSSFDSEELDVSDSGKYTVKGDVINFDSEDNEDFDGEVTDGKITIVMEDEDGIFGGDVELKFEKVM